VTITTAQPLSDTLKTKVMTMLTEQTRANIDLVQIVDPEIIGGFIIQMDDHYLDSSILSKINKLRQEFSQNSFQVQF
jgi:F-type H+-transporting ATPase subunit delta